METADSDTRTLVGVACLRARAEFAETVAIVRYRNHELSRIAASGESGLRKRIERSAISLSIGQALGLSEVQVSSRLVMADRLIEYAPAVWGSFRTGVVNEARVYEISKTLGKLEREESRQRLDATVVTYAATHTVSELKAWLKRFIRRVEADLAIERAERAREERRVEFEHGDDGMTWMTALLPSHQAAAIRTRLWNQARTLKHDDKNDGRTVAQREADTLVDAVLAGTDGEAKSTGMRVDIAVTIDVHTFAAARAGFAESTDGTWGVPVNWILEAAANGDSFWHRLLVDNHSGNTLTHTYAGYAPPDLLRRAIRFRSGVCVTPGCMKPAEHCELDHRTNWPQGPTTGANLDPRCKKHHGLKGHGFMPAVMVEHQREHTHHLLPPWQPQRPEQQLTNLIQQPHWR